MSETKPSETRPRRVVGRNVAIALGIVCILLIAGLGGAMAYYTMTINDKNSKIDSINAQLAAITGNNTNTNATEIIDQLHANITKLTNEKNQLQTRLDGNKNAATNYANDHSYTNEQYQNLQNQISSLNAQVTSLQSQIADLQAPSLVRINLGESDNRPFLRTPYLHIQSAITNVGTNTAYNCKLHVVLYQGATITKDTFVLLGTISGRAGISSTNDVQYSGSALTGWTITPQWTATP